MLHSAVWSGGIQLNVCVRIGPLEASNDAGRASRVLQVVVGGGVMGGYREDWECEGDKEYEEYNSQRHTSLMSDVSSTRFGQPCLANLSMARPICSVLVTYLGKRAFKNGSNGVSST